MSGVLNGNTKYVIALLTILGMVGGAAAGYGSLQRQVQDIHDDVASVHVEINEAKTNPAATPAGVSLQAQLNEVNHRLDRIEQNQDQLLRILSHAPNR